MTDVASARALLSSIPGWAARPAKLTVLDGGLNHCSYLVESAGFQYVLRVASHDNVAGGGNRELEYFLQQQAAAQGLAAPVLYSDASRGLLLMELLQGDLLTAEQLASREVLRELAELLSKLHTQPLCGVNFAPVAAAEAYLVALGEARSEVIFGRRCLDIISKTPLPRERRCCHNDVVASNIIRGRSLRLIDFEYACDNDPLFDLASVLCWHNLGAAERKLLLEAYAGEITKELSARLRAQCRLFDALQWLWLTVRQHQCPEPWAESHLETVRNRLI